MSDLFIIVPPGGYEAEGGPEFELKRTGKTAGNS